VPTLLIHDLPGVDRIGATTGGLPLQRMKQPCPAKGGLEARELVYLHTAVKTAAKKAKSAGAD